MNKQMENNGFIQKNSPDGGFLQMPEWRKFQQSVGRKTFHIEKEYFNASIIEHSLPIVGKYFYVPRGPVISLPTGQAGHQSSACLPDRQVISHQMRELVDLARENKAGWIRIEPASEKILELIRKSIKEKIVRAPHDMQPKEIFLIDISKPEQQLLSEMKSKTRYNIGLAKKKNVLIKSSNSQTEEEKTNLVESFLRLTKEMTTRQGIATHGEQYYRKMIGNFPEEIIKIYAAEYEGKIIAANLVLFNGEYATYLHGASGDEHRNVMAPFLLQWQAILDAKESGCKYYDFGGVQTPGVKHQKHSSLVGVTNFKLGFSTVTKSMVFPGSFDIIINPRAYAIYRGLQKAKAIVYSLRR